MSPSPEPHHNDITSPMFIRQLSPHLALEITAEVWLEFDTSNIFENLLNPIKEIYRTVLYLI